MPNLPPPLDIAKEGSHLRDSDSWKVLGEPPMSCAPCEVFLLLDSMSLCFPLQEESLHLTPPGKTCLYCRMVNEMPTKYENGIESGYC